MATYFHSLTCQSADAADDGEDVWLSSFDDVAADNIDGAKRASGPNSKLDFDSFLSLKATEFLFTLFLINPEIHA